MTHRVIAIDGPAASGKGTLARKIAEILNYAHLDTGALYRAVANILLMAGHNPADEEQAILAAHTLKETLQPKDLDNPRLREDDVGAAASKVAAIQKVRDILFNLQRAFAKAPKEGYAGCVLDGRDIGTVICPEADFKLFVTADDEIRAKRRHKELQSRDIAVTYDAVLTDMRERDKRDSTRGSAPMKPAEDALILDTSDLSADEALEEALAYINKNA